MDRRVFLRGCGLALFGSIPGCSSEPIGTAKPDPKLQISPKVEEIENGWELTSNLSVSLESLHGVTLLAYTGAGSEVCRQQAGDFDVPGIPGGTEKTVTTTCSRFPAIITATAKETPCDGANIEILYWIGTDEQRHEDVAGDVKLWETTTRRCDEQLPPQRVIRNVNATETEGTDTA